MDHANTNTPRPRREAFDHLRGIAAVAVVVLHGAYAYSLQPLVGLLWTVPLDEPNRLVDALFWAIEGCVMPIFFLMSGFFLAQSLARQSPGRTFRGRSKRLLVPLAAIGIPVLLVDLWVWGFGLVQMGQVSMNRYLVMKYPREIRADLFGPAHLWYVEYLWVMCAAVCLASWAWTRLSGSRTAETPAESAGLTRPLLGTATLGVLIALVLACEPAIVVGFQHGWLPAPPKFLHGLLFLLLGMLLWRSESLLSSVKAWTPVLLTGAAAAFYLMLPRVHATLQTGDGTAFDPAIGLVLAAYALLATGGIVGACLRWLNEPRPVLAALGAASFWIYIVHHPILGVAHLGLRPLPLPAAAKFMIATGATLAICLASYHYLVRDGALGKLLGGTWPWPRQPAKRPDTIPAPNEAATRQATSGMREPINDRHLFARSQLPTLAERPPARYPSPFPQAETFYPPPATELQIDGRARHP